MVGIEAGIRVDAEHLPPVVTINAAGTSPFVLVCDHASNRIPQRLGDLGLTPHQRLMHIAWDPGALAVAMRLTELLDAPLVQSTISRLVIDCNRDHNAIDLIPVISERTDIPANVGLPQAERDYRIAAYHQPFHDAIDELIEQRRQAGVQTILVTVHSFTPVYKEVPRPWPIGLIHGQEERFTHALDAALRADEPRLNVGWNEPYSARNGVTFTLEHHGDGRSLDCTMIEIRHDEILEMPGVEAWARRLERALLAAAATLQVGTPALHTGQGRQPHA